MAIPASVGAEALPQASDLPPLGPSAIKYRCARRFIFALRFSGRRSPPERRPFFGMGSGRKHWSAALQSTLSTPNGLSVSGRDAIARTIKGRVVSFGFWCDANCPLKNPTFTRCHPRQTERSGVQIGDLVGVIRLKPMGSPLFVTLRFTAPGMTAQK
jgi:hypothetical protein